MPRYYKPESFLRYLKYNTVREFLEFIGIDNKLPPKLKKQSRADYLKKLFDSFNESTNTQIDAIFREVHAMGNEGGIVTLLNLFKGTYPNLAKEIQNKSNNYNQALYIYMKDPDLFKRAATLSYYDEKKIKAQRNGLKQVPVNELYAQKEALAKAISQYLMTTHGRGENCVVETHDHYEGKVLFVALPEDYVRPDLHYESDRLIRSTKKPSFEIIFIYYPNEGKIELSCKGGKKRQIALFNIFNQTVLQDSKPILGYQTLYDLDKVLNDNFELVTKLEDEIETVQVKKIRLTDRHNKTRQIYLQIEGKGIKPIQEETKQRNVDLKTFKVTQVSFGLKFPGKGRKGSVTMELTAPDKCNLNESDLHKRAKHYIAYWGLDYQATDQDPS